jgi:hypothetical protein
MNLIYQKVIDSLEKSLSKEDWIDFVESLDQDSADEFVDMVNEKVSEIAPEIFANPLDFSSIKDEEVK